MTLTGTRTFVGFGFGAIQSGLFLYEAYQSGAFRRLVVAEVLEQTVADLRAAGGQFSVNIAHADRIESVRIGAMEIENPAQSDDRVRLVAALAEAEEIATAVPSIAFYSSDSPGSLHRVLAEGLRRKAAQGGPRAVVYAAENHNHAAEHLEAAVMSAIPADEQAAVRERVRFLNTVIGKMSGLVTPQECESLGLAAVTEGTERAFLVEAFNRILITRIDFPEPFERGIRVFEEKADLLPFEEAKLYGHNATHALAAYIAGAAGMTHISDLRAYPDVMAFLREAFIEESGVALCRKYAGLDPLFTPAGYAAFADDLLARMTNPYLRDTVERVGRDPARKLGWDDRLVGTMRLALKQHVEPLRYALGVLAALAVFDPGALRDSVALAAALDRVWESAAPDAAERAAVLRTVEHARPSLEPDGSLNPARFSL